MDAATAANGTVAPCHTASEVSTRRWPGLRASALARKRDVLGIGQLHLARVLGLDRPALSYLEREAFGAIPRGFSTRYQQALATIEAAAGVQCWRGCGCRR